MARGFTEIIPTRALDVGNDEEGIIDSMFDVGYRR